MRTLTLLLFLTTVCTQAAPRPNIVFIVSDDQAWGDYGFMGHEKIKTPHLDKLAKESLVFRRGYVPSSLCCPSLASLLAGRYPHQTKITGNEPPIPAGLEKEAKRYQDPTFRKQVEELNDFMRSEVRLPAELGKQGYVSLQTGKWWAGNYRNGGFTEGMSEGDVDHGGRHGDVGLDIGRKTMEPIYKFIEKAQADTKPFFIWYAPMLPHQPHDPPARLLEKYKALTPSIHVAKYWANCELFDETCGQLLDYLDERKLRENTLVVFLADNGWIQDPEKPKFRLDSKLSQYDGGLRTPIMLRWPAKIEPKMSDLPATTVDLAPTIYQALEMPKYPSLPGLNLLDEAALKERNGVSGACFTHNAVDIHQPGKNVTYRWTVAGEWKLILPNVANLKEKNRENVELGAVELYHITEDPNEEKNLAKEQPEKVKELAQRMDQWWDGK